MQNKVLVIGSSGQVASSLKRLSLSNFYFVGRPNFSICNKSHIDKVLDTIQPELVINCSAYTNVDGCESEIELAYAINSEAVKDLAIACNRRNLPLIHISTDYVFDGKQNHPYTEFNIPNPQSIYGKSKLAGEENIRNHLDQHIILRTSWLFSQYGTNFVKTMVSLAKTKKKIFVVNDQIGSPTFVDNLVVVILEIASKLLANWNIVKFGTYHYTDTFSVSWYEFAKEIFATIKEKFDMDIPQLNSITSDKYSSVAMRPHNSVLDCSMLERELGIKQKKWHNSLENCLENIIKI